MTLLLGSKHRLLLIGDSITDAGRAYPVGKVSTGLGGGYPSHVEALLTGVHPEMHIEVINTGISGNTVRDLKRRWQSDVIDLKPDWLSIMIGTNDVWRQFDSVDPNAAVPPGEFEATLNTLVVQTKSHVKGLVLLTPFLVQTDTSDPFRATMDKYGAIVKSIAKDNDVILVDTQAAFNKALQHVCYESLAEDRVHPSQAGHLILAKSLLDAVGFTW